MIYVQYKFHRFDQCSLNDHFLLYQAQMKSLTTIGNATTSTQLIDEIKKIEEEVKNVLECDSGVTTEANLHRKIQILNQKLKVKEDIAAAKATFDTAANNTSIVAIRILKQSCEAELSKLKAFTSDHLVNQIKKEQASNESKSLTIELLPEEIKLMILQRLSIIDMCESCIVLNKHFNYLSGKNNCNVNSLLYEEIKQMMVSAK